MRTTSGIVNLFLLALLAPGCARHLGARAERRGDDYVMTFFRCDEPGGPPRVGAVKVDKAIKPDYPTVCLLQHVDVNSKELGATWTYGASAPGYRLDDCRALEKGGSYRLVVSAIPVTAIAYFRLDDKGDVHMISDGCPR
jgi:hypothetical protein